MNSDTNRNLRAITTALLVATMLLGIFALVPSITMPVRAGVTDPSSISVVAKGGGLSVEVQDGDGVRFVHIHEANGKTVKGFPCTTGLVNIPIKGSFPILVKVADCHQQQTKISIRAFELDGTGNIVARPTRHVADGGPGTSTILITQYANVPAESIAFEAGHIDMVEWAQPDAFIDAWTGPATDPRAIVTRGEAHLQKYLDIGMFEMDINNWNWPTTEKSLRQALGYMVDRARIVGVIAGGRATPICVPAPDGQHGSISCTLLGYPTQFGEFSLRKALQVLYEGNWRDCATPKDGSLVLTLDGTCATAQPKKTLIFISRADDPIRTGAANQLVEAMTGLPNTFTDKATGATVTVCTNDFNPSLPGIQCGLNVDHRNVPRGTASSIVFRGPWKDWNIYTGGWGLGWDPDHAFFLYGSSFAPEHCGGGWPFDFPLNYPCNVDPGFDAVSGCLVTAPTYTDLTTCARNTYRYGWGYSAATGKITGTMPTIPLYTFIGEKVAWNTDYGDKKLTVNPDGTRACWTGFVPQEVGTGIDNLATLTGLYLDNCQPLPGYVSHRGEKGTKLDWGFRTTIDNPNILTSSWLWDILLLQFVYDTCLGRNPITFDLVTSMCENWGEGRYFNAALQREATVGVYKFGDGIMWSDGRFLTALDYKFTIEYVHCNFGWNFGLVEHVYDSDGNSCNGMDGIVVKDADPVNGIGGTAHVYFDITGALLVQNAGFLWVQPRHEWCNSWPNTVADCAFPDPRLYPPLDIQITQGKPVGVGPYRIVSCTDACLSTIRLEHNPFYWASSRWWNVPGATSLQPDLDRNGIIDENDLGIIDDHILTGAQEPVFDVDYRIFGEVGPGKQFECLGKKKQTFENSFNPGVILSVSLCGPHPENVDRYIVQRFIQERGGKGLPGVLWPPSRHMTYNWPDTDKDNDVDLDDVIRTFLNQFQTPKPPVAQATYNSDVDYDGDVDLDDLIITFVRQFQVPFGVKK